MRWRNIAGVLILLFAMSSMLYSWRIAIQQEKDRVATARLAQCTTEWNTFLYEALIARSSASAEVAQTLDTMILSIRNSTTREATVKAIDDYIAARAKAKDTNAKNPLPLPPKDTCKEGK